MKKLRKKSTKARMQNSCACSSDVSSSRLLEIGGMLITIVAVYEILSAFDLLSFATQTQTVLGLGTVFLIGLTASASSCLAMVGGLLLSVSAQWSERHPRMSRLAKFEPLLHFNLGRVIGYFVFGGLTGLLGQTLILSVHTTGVLKVILSLVMILLGLNILKIVPKKYCSIPLPKFLWKQLQKLHASDSVIAPFLLGAVTFFIPCGFTQSMQLLALGSGSFTSGAAIMATFALGTLPALLGISAASTIASGKTGRVFFTFAGTLSLFLGVLNANSGLALAGINVSQLLPTFLVNANEAGSDPDVTIDENGQQIISVSVDNRGYSKGDFVIEPNTPTWIYATAPEQLSGCISSMTIPDFNLSKPLQKGENWIGPIKPSKNFAFMCSMGMFRADVRVRS